MPASASPTPAQVGKKPPPPPLSDDALLCGIVLRLVVNKARFCEQAEKAGGDGGDLPKIGELESLDTHGDTAVGWRS